mmetsp:Transcript_413/g.268  ORF Transcript_413/g.268 Transcript_413/m.268 type:complete len:90 (+) Transcript_413:178-447(+)
MVSLLMKGLPYNTKALEIREFYLGYKILPESIKFGKNQLNQKTGHATLLFESEIEAKKAFVEKQGQYIGHRWILIYLQSYLKYAEFEAD